MPKSQCSSSLWMILHVHDFLTWMFSHNLKTLIFLSTSMFLLWMFSSNIHFGDEWWARWEKEEITVKSDDMHGIIMFKSARNIWMRTRKMKKNIFMVVAWQKRNFTEISYKTRVIFKNFRNSIVNNWNSYSYSFTWMKANDDDIKSLCLNAQNMMLLQNERKLFNLSA